MNSIREGRRLGNGMIAVRVVDVELIRTTHTGSVWNMTLACGCRIENQRRSYSFEPPEFAGCGKDHTQELES
jgi:hypothetical protein